MMRETYLVRIFLIFLVQVIVSTATLHDYGDALSKSILFFDGQRSGKLPSTQRLTWRGDSALKDGVDKGVDLTGGYYDAGDNVKFNFPMAFSTTVLAWGVLEYGKSMGPDLPHALEAVRWSTDYFLKSTAIPDVVFAQVGDPIGDHNCWQRPEDMDTPRTVYAVTKESPGSEVAAEMAAALAASSLVFKAFGDGEYSTVLLKRASKAFEFADKYKGSYNESIGYGVCPFYCDFNGYQGSLTVIDFSGVRDELLWAAAWLHKATQKSVYWDYITHNIKDFKPRLENNIAEFGWDAKHAGINVLVSKYVLKERLESTTSFLSNADNFVCSILPESPTKIVNFSPGGLLFKPGACNMQHTTALSFLLLIYARYLKSSNHVIRCGNVIINQNQIVRFTRSQLAGGTKSGSKILCESPENSCQVGIWAHSSEQRVDYILGINPMNMSYMVGYGNKFPQRIHHRGSSLPSIVQQPQHIECKGGTPYFLSGSPNPNLLIGAVVGGPNIDDSFADDRIDAATSEPTTYVNAPLVGVLAYFKGRSARIR